MDCSIYHILVFLANPNTILHLFIHAHSLAYGNHNTQNLLSLFKSLRYISHLSIINPLIFL